MLYSECIKAMQKGTLITKTSSRDKEFHFQNWCENRISEIGLNYDDIGRNRYPDFTLVDYPEGYEVKGLEFPGRIASFDANSNVPSGKHNGRTIFYIFGRYPKSDDELAFPLTDLIICHGDFLNANHDYVHENKHVRGFGTYGDIMIRDRKMYVVPTPYSLLDDATGAATLIVPDDYDTPNGFINTSSLVRVEGDSVVVGYSFDLISNTISAKTIVNPNEGKRHCFKALRHESQMQPNTSYNNISGAD
jgi:hypothetical protein